MSRSRWLFVITLILALALPLVGCGGDSVGGAGGGGAGVPTKATMIAHLEGMLGAIQAKDWDKAAGHMYMWKGAPPKDRWPDVIGGFEQRGEISKAGIAILAAKAKFGPLADVFPERGKSWAERVEVPLERCYGLAYEGAEVAAYASDEGLKLIRLDDVGKLK